MILLWQDLTINEDRKEYVTFTDAYYQASQRSDCTKCDNTEFDDLQRCGQQVAAKLC